MTYATAQMPQGMVRGGVVGLGGGDQGLSVQGASQTLTCGSQHHCLTVNIQLRRSGPTLQDFIK